MRQQSAKSRIGGGGDGDGNSNSGWQQRQQQRRRARCKGRGAEVIGVDGNNKDCGVNARSLSMAVIVNGGGNGMEPMEPIGVNEGCSKDAIATSAIHHRCSQQWPPLPPLMTNNNCWLLAVVVINCAAAAMMVIDDSNSVRHRGQGDGEAIVR